jgi:ferredoxin-NADP reductase
VSIPPRNYTVKVKERFYISPDVYILRVEFPSDLVYAAGQYISFRLIKDGRPIMKAYSIASPPHMKDSYVEFCIKRIDEPVPGFASNLLANVPIGSTLEAYGPLGRFTVSAPVQRDLVFVATGTGITPFMSILGTLFHEMCNKEIWLFHGIRYENGLLYHDQLAKWTNEHANFHYHPTLSRASEAWSGERGYVQNLLKRYVTDPKGKQVYICGLKKMVDEVIAVCNEIGFEKGQVHIETYI